MNIVSTNKCARYLLLVKSVWPNEQLHLNRALKLNISHPEVHYFGGFHFLHIYTTLTAHLDWKVTVISIKYYNALSMEMTQQFVVFVPGDLDICSLTLTFKLVRARDQRRLTCEFGANPFSGSQDMWGTNKKNPKVAEGTKTEPYLRAVNTSAYCSNNVSKPTYQWTISVSAQLKNAEDAAMLRWQTAHIRQLMTLNWRQTNYIDLVVGVHRQHFHHHRSSFCWCCWHVSLKLCDPSLHCSICCKTNLNDKRYCHVYWQTSGCFSLYWMLCWPIYCKLDLTHRDCDWKILCLLGRSAWVTGLMFSVSQASMLPFVNGTKNQYRSPMAFQHHLQHQHHMTLNSEVCKVGQSV